MYNNTSSSDGYKEIKNNSQIIQWSIMKSQQNMKAHLWRHKTSRDSGVLCMTTAAMAVLCYGTRLFNSLLAQP